MSRPITLLKKLASNGFIVFSVSRKPYNFLTSSSFPARASFICDTSDVSNSHAVFGYLQDRNIIRGTENLFMNRASVESVYIHLLLK